MPGLPLSTSRWLQQAASLLLIALATGNPLPAHATGDYGGPGDFLAEGGRQVDASPEFYWEAELRRLARDFQPPEKLAPVNPQDRMDPDQGTRFREGQKQQTQAADLADFAEALKSGRLKVTDPAAAEKSHRAARDLLATITAEQAAELPPEADSEFADYHRGAWHYAQGGTHLAEAKAAWEKLLARPAAQRHYRTVWAAHMLGRVALKQQPEKPEAAEWFRRARQWAHEGFADALNLAAESYGWEARSEWKQGHPEKAAPLWLTQLAMGDETAIVSLKALIPDRRPIEGMLNYGPEVEELQGRSDEQKQAAEKETLRALEIAAHDPLLRRLVTMHILSTATHRDFYPDEVNGPDQRSRRWLETLSHLKLKTLRDAEYLGWMAYNVGDYAGATRWLALAENRESPAAAWLQAKLLRRAGKLPEAAKSMELAWRGLLKPETYFGYEPPGYQLAASEVWSPNYAVSGDLASLRLARGEFVQAFETFRQGRLDGDAAFVGERVLTTEELKSCVDRLPKPAADDADFASKKWRWMLGRRLVREDRYEEALPYFPPAYRLTLEAYRKALKEAAETGRAPRERAWAWFRAAWLARKWGMELMGTEEAPDGFSSEGSFESPDIAGPRLTGKYKEIDFSTGRPLAAVKPVLPKATKEELARLEQTRIRPDLRFHYRFIAAALAMKAAALLPDHTEELADVINIAGNWVKDRDEELGNRYYAVAEKRCPKTKIGKAMLAKHWFTDDSGPWTEKVEKEYDPLFKQMEKASSVLSPETKEAIKAALEERKEK